MRHFLRCSAYVFPCRALAAKWQARKVPWVASRSALRHSARSAFTAAESEPCELARDAQYEMAEYGGDDAFFSSMGRSSHFTSGSDGPMGLLAEPVPCEVVSAAQEAPRQTARSATERARIMCRAIWDFACQSTLGRGRIQIRRCAQDYAAMVTSVPGGTSSKRSTMSWLRMRMHPIDPGFPISTASGLPWM